MNVHLQATVQALGRTSAAHLDGVEILRVQDVRGSKQEVQFHARFNIVKPEGIHETFDNRGLGLGSVVAFDADQGHDLVPCVLLMTVVYNKKGVPSRHPKKFFSTEPSQRTVQNSYL